MINKPWVPFPDFEEHLAISHPTINIIPEIEARRAEFAGKLAVTALIAMGDPETPAVERHRMASYLASLSARVSYRRRILLSVLDMPLESLPAAVRGSREPLIKASHDYWLVTQIANVLVLMPSYETVLGWAIDQFLSASRSDVEYTAPPWRSARLGAAMSRKYKHREAFLAKLWGNRFPTWMRAMHRSDKPKN
jgi:hypothetical protein